MLIIIIDLGSQQYYVQITINIQLFSLRNGKAIESFMSIPPISWIEVQLQIRKYGWKWQINIQNNIRNYLFGKLYKIYFLRLIIVFFKYLCNIIILLEWWIKTIWIIQCFYHALKFIEKPMLRVCMFIQKIIICGQSKLQWYIISIIKFTNAHISKVWPRNSQLLPNNTLSQIIYARVST